MTAAAMIAVVGAAAGPVGVAWLLLRRTNAGDCGVGLRICAAFGFGLGCASLVWWILLQLPLTSVRTLLLIDMAVWYVPLTGLAISERRRNRTGPTAPSSGGRRSRTLRTTAAGIAVLVPLSVLAVASFTSQSAVMPHGNWDAWAIWNSRARFLHSGFPDLWRDGFSAILGWSHPDYPLLLPASIARLWTFGGHDSTGVPILMAALFAIALAVLPGLVVARHHSPLRGCITSAFILAYPAFLIWAPSQGADVPLAFYLLLAFAFASAAAQSDRPLPLWACAGLAAGLAGWTKNEGIVFALTFMLVPLIVAWRRQVPFAPRAAAVAAGAALPLMVVLWFKLSLAPPNDIVSAQSAGHLAAMLADPDRLRVVGSAVATGVWSGGSTTIGVLPILAIFALATGVRPRQAPAALAALVVLGLMLLTYIAVYLVSPHDLAWHLGTSLDRLILHLVPSAVWATMLMLRPPAQAPGQAHL